jgi:hypothetical protein
VNALHGVLKAVEELDHLRVHLALEARSKVLLDNSVGSRKEG